MRGPELPMTIDRWFPTLELPFDERQFNQLPRHPAYEYAHWDGAAHLTPRPIAAHCLLPLHPRTIPAQVVTDSAVTVELRPLCEEDWAALPQVFAESFRETAPFSLLTPGQRLVAARACLDRTREGGDGPFVAAASFVARTPAGACGAALITLSPAADLDSFDDDRWHEPAPANAWKTGWGRPHLTWVFVQSRKTRNGLAAALLACAGNTLLSRGYHVLASTFLLGNEPSLLWHWRQGFELVGSLPVSRDGSGGEVDLPRERFDGA